MSPQEFVAKWKHVDLKESASAQSHFNDLCALIGHSTPTEADPTGQFFTFEAGADKTQGGQGRADVWKKGCFAWEYKGKHANLDKAYQQLLQYREALENPPLLIVSDTDQIIIHTNFTNTIKRTYPIALEELVKPESLALLRNAFNHPDALRAPQTPAQVTQDAAAQFAHLAELLYKYGHPSQAVAHFLIRLLFCLFAEDVELLPNKLFSHLVQNTSKTPKAFAAQLGELFAKMQTGGYFGGDLIPHVNGGLFDNATALGLDSDGLRILMEATALDWSSIEPSIFGTLFERGLDPDKRSQLGAHYTSKEDILLIVEPVLMSPLRRRWNQVQARARELAALRSKLPAKSRIQRDALQKEIDKLLRGFAEEIARVQMLDPACGSGNFLYVALRQLLDLWKEVSSLLSELGSTFLVPLPGASPYPTQLHGIEINPFAYELAQATIWIGYIQWMRENGFGTPPEPILAPRGTIEHRDAILAYDAHGQPVELDWPPANVIIGNPPFLGSRRMRPALGEQYCDSLLKVYKGRIGGLPDLVCYWFEKARHQLAQHKAQRVGLLGTQAIRGGANRQVLENIKKTGNIFWAWSDREWVLDGAMVHVSMIGFDDGTEKQVSLDGNIVPSINSDLTANVDLSQARRLEENANLSFQGVVLRGPFDITHEQAQKMMAEMGNPNGRPNNDVIKPRRIGKDITGHSSNSYAIDFSVDMPIEKAAQYVAPFEYIKKHVYPMRQKANQPAAREKWWIHWNPRVQMREALSRLPKYIATPRVAKHRIFVWLDSSILPDAQLVVFARSDHYFFGVLHSRAHELWARGTGTQLREAESGFRYTSTTTFETFPFPRPPGKEPKRDSRVKAIAQAARELVQQRDAWLNPSGATEAELKKRTLTNLYNERPTWLDLAHRKLDEAVFDAYGWPHDLSDEEILARLLALNLKRAKE
jgi:type II restriction/modification system DNA methylase subunit YeeA